VAARIEKGIENINQVNLITSRPFESWSEITIRFEEISQCDFDRRIQDLRTVDDRIRDLPEQIPDEPEVTSVEAGSRSYPMITVVVTGDLSEKQLKFAAEKIEEQILATFQIEGKEIEFREVLLEEAKGIQPKQVFILRILSAFTTTSNRGGHGVTNQDYQNSSIQCDS